MNYFEQFKDKKESWLDGLFLGFATGGLVVMILFGVFHI